MPPPALRYPAEQYSAAYARARALTAVCGLEWTAEWRVDTGRWHVVLTPAALRQVTPATLGRQGSRRPTTTSRKG